MLGAVACSPTRTETEEPDDLVVVVTPEDDCFDEAFAEEEFGISDAPFVGPEMNACIGLGGDKPRQPAPPPAPPEFKP